MANIVKEKSLDYAVKIVRLTQSIMNDRKEFIMSKQLLRSGTSVGAQVRESEHAESKPDFIHKLAIAQKEINESLYWLELLHKTGFLSQQDYEETSKDSVELLRLLTSIIKSTKRNMGVGNC